ncbi:unnamed protein product [Ilex paraguariensis]|uniref:Uncharacterized protein n=1 Tax=Ilex paraguariensis TaxID=185542 RepID=A0ABC8R5Z7_9AQUA
MKMMKTMKKLKFWSRKKKKKKTHLITDYPPPPCHCHCLCHPIQPSAPPLPSWLDYELTHDTIFTPEAGSVSSLAGLSQVDFAPQDIVHEVNPVNPTLSYCNTSYQQYMVPNPVYGVPVVSEVRRERSGGIFGCVFDIGVHLIRCFCPCFRIREVY